MENYVIYDELSSSEQGVVYKGRRKGTIEFVAVHCVDKRYRAFVTNSVRLLHNLKHSNILKFFEWYETSNHLWVVSEILSGGSLSDILDQDGHLPESVVRDFGVDICKGLFHLHQNSVIYAQLNPSAIALDSTASAKLIDFRFARLLDEDLDAIFGQVSPKEKEPSDVDWRQSFLAHPHYSSPEVLNCADPGGPETMTMAADIWSLGVCLYRMFVGQVPFPGQTPDEVLKRIHEGDRVDIPPSSMKDASTEILDLIDGLLRVDLSERLSWKRIISHPFWNGILKSEIDVGMAELSLRDSAGSDDTVKNDTDSLENTGETAMMEATGELREDEDEEEAPVDDGDQWHLVRRLSRPQREVSGGGNLNESRIISSSKPIEGDDSLFGLSISHTSLPALDRKPSPSPPKRGVPAEDVDSDESDDDDDASMIFHPSDIVISHPYPDPPKGGSVRFDANTLPFKVVPPSKAVGASHDSLDATFDNVKSVLTAVTSGQSKSVTTQRQLAVLSYLGSLVHQHRVNAGDFISTSLVRHHPDIPTLLTQLIKSNVADDSVRQQSVYVLAAILYVAFTNPPAESKKNAKEGEEPFPPRDLDVNKILLVLSEVVRDGTTSKLLRSQCLVASHHAFRMWTLASGRQFATPFPSLSLTVVSRGLRAEATSSSAKEELRAVAACVRIVHVLISFLRRARVKNRGFTSSSSSSPSSSSSKETLETIRSKLSSPELTQTLWTIVSRSPEMNLRCLAASTLIAIGKNDPSVLYACVDRAGLPAVIGVLTGESNNRPPVSAKERKVDSNTSLFTQLTSTILNILLRHPSHATKISQNKDASKQLTSSCESTNPLVRAKTIAAIHAMIVANREAFVGCCKNRLVGVLEREIKQLGSLWNVRGDDHGKTWKRDDSVYLLISLSQFVEYLKRLAQEILKDSCEALRQVSGRKHPSANQSIRLKNSLPHLHPLHQVLSSGVLRPLVLKDPLILHHLVGILNETPTIDSKSTNLDPALGTGQTEEVVKVVLSLFEVLAVSSKTFAPSDADVSPAASVASDAEESSFENSPIFDLLTEGVFPPLFSMMTPNSSSTPVVLRLTTHLLSPIMVAPSPKLHVFVVERLLPRLTVVIGDGGGELTSSSTSHSLIPSLGLSLLHILLALSPHPLNAGDIPVETKSAMAAAVRDVVEGHLNRSHLLTPTVNQALSIFATLLSSSSKDVSSVERFPPLWTQAHQDWKVVSLLVAIVKTAEIDPDELIADGGSSVSQQFVEALLGLLHTIVQFVSDRIRFVVTSHKSGKPVDTAAAENLLLLHRPLIRAFSPLLHHLMASPDFDLASTAIQCLSQLAQLFGGEHHPSLTRRHLELYARALTADASPDVRKSAMGQHVRTILRTLKRLALVGGGKEKRRSKKMEQVIAVFREDEEANEGSSLLAVLSRLSQVAASHADVPLASVAREIIEATEG